MAGYRPSDTLNLGFGVIVSYEFRADGTQRWLEQTRLCAKGKAAKLQLRLEQRRLGDKQQ